MKNVPRVHAVTDTAIATLPNLSVLAAAVAVSPDVALHARAPGWDARPLLELGRTLLGAATALGSPVLVNDRVDVACILEARGAHLPEQGLPIAAARDMLGATALIGRSTHSAAAARRAADEGADYVFLGPIWETASHPGRPALGIETITAAQPARVVAIGGITPERAAQCRDAGAWGVAAISGLWHAADPGSAVRAMLLSFGHERGPHHGQRPAAGAD